MEIIASYQAGNNAQKVDSKLNPTIRGNEAH